MSTKEYVVKQCYQAVINAATGRNLNKSDIQAIFDNIFKNQQVLARNDPNWKSLSAEEKLRQAAEYGVNEAIRQKQLKRNRVALTILARDRIDNQISDIIARGASKNKLEALNRLLSYNPDNKTGFQSLDTRANSTRNWAIGQMLEALDHSKLLGLFEDEQGIKDLVHEMYGENTGNPKAQEGAKQWKQQTDLLRETFNNAGGDIGKLHNWGLPQEHSQIKIAKAGLDQWLNDIIPALDRSYYVHPDGTLMDDAQLKSLFTDIYETVSTGGVNKLNDMGHPRSTFTANKRKDARQIFYKNADSFLKYHSKYGDHGIFDILIGHVSGLSRDIAAIETFGPNPDLMFRSVFDDAYKESKISNRTESTKIDKVAKNTKDLYDFVTGNYSPIVKSRFATVMDSARNLLTSSRLGSATLTSISDQGTLLLMAQTNGIALGSMYKKMLSSLNPFAKNDKNFAQRNGLALDSTLASLNRWGIDNMKTNWTSKAASTVLRLSGLLKITDAAKEGYATSMMSSIGHVVSTNTNLSTLAKTSKFDAELIRHHGISDIDFDVWKLAKLEVWSGVKNVLTPEAIMSIPNTKLTQYKNPQKVKFEAARKLIGMLSEEADVAVITPGTRDRLRLGAGLPRGTASGEILRSVTQFKAFPFALVARMWARGSNLPTGLQKLYFGGTFLLSATLLGAAALQINNIASGRKPQEMDDINFWREAMLKGGSLGVYGDFIFSDTNSYGSTMGEMAIGPLGSSIAQFADLTLGNARRLSSGGETNFGGDSVRFIKGITPGANLWYTKAVTDHLLFNQLQEAISPGYLDKYTKRQKKIFGRDFWWKPNEILPEDF